MPDLDVDGWELDSAEARHAASPATFEIPSREERDSLLPGRRVKLLFLFMNEKNGHPIVSCERMWVKITARTANGYAGRLDSTPVTSSVLKRGAAVDFGPEHIASILARRRWWKWW